MMVLMLLEKVKFAVTLLLVMAVLVPVCSAQKRFYIAPDDHTDYFWIADDATYRTAFLNMIDYYLNKMDQTRCV